MRHKILLDSDIQTDPLISARRPGLVLISEKISCLFDHRVKIKESKYLDFARGLKNAVEHEDKGDTNNNQHARNSPQVLG